MSLAAQYEAALGPAARVSDLEWRVDDPEAARQAVQIALGERAALSPGRAHPGRTGLRPPAGILTLWREELVARVGAGTTVASLERSLEPHGLGLGLEVPDPDRATLGACYAAGRSGFASARGIGLRDRCIGLSFVDGRARLLAAGSRVVKNVAGYDFGRLHHSARGALGLVLDLTVRLVVRQQDRRAVWWSCEREGIPARLPELRRAWGGDVAAEVFVDRVAAVRYGLPGEGVVFRQEGDADLLAERIDRTDAVDVSPRWPALLGASLRGARRLPASTLSVQDPGEDWVADLATGVLRRAGDAPPRRGGPSRATLAIKRVFDPSGIWPDLPGAEEGP